MNRLASIALPLRTLRCVSNTSSKLLVSINLVKLSASQFSSVSTHSKSNNSNNHNVSKPMKAIVLNKTGPLENLEYLKDVPRPSYTSTEVLVKVSACAVCHRDLLDRQGAFPFIRTPVIPGHELSGTVVEVGKDVKTLAVGDKVVSMHWGACGKCPACLAGATTQCKTAKQSFLGLTANGGYAEFISASDSTFAKVPEGFNSLEAAPIMCTYGTVWRAAITRGRLAEGETILVTGASGGVGSAMVQIAKAMNCKILAVTSSESKVDYIKKLGADHVIISSDGKFHNDPIFKTIKPQVAFEAVGEPTFAASLRTLAPGGRLVLVGNVTVGSSSIKLGYLIINSIELIGSDSCTTKELEDAMQFMKKHNIKPPISSVLPLSQAREAQKLLHDKKVTGRVVLKVNEESEW